MRKPIVAGAGLVLLLVASALLVATAVPGRQPERSLSVYPGHGTPTASARTTISLRGAPPRKLRSVRVTGSRSGAHAGRLAAHSDGRGASFIPRRPFVEGETVTVRTGRRVHGVRGGVVRFRIAHEAPRLRPVPERPMLREPSETMRFRSRPDLRPPRPQIDVPAQGTAPGYLFVAPKNGKGGQDGPMIFDDRGEPVLFMPLPGRQATDLRVQRYRGRPVLTWWEGTVVLPGSGYGRFVISDQSYRRIASFGAGNGYRGDLHEFVLTPRGTALVLASNPVWTSLSEVGGPRRAVVLDQIVQEIDVETGLVLFEWHSLGRIGLAETYEELPPNPEDIHDYVHANSIDELPGGDLLVSARNTHAVYRIDRETGAIKWRLGGRRSSFRMGARARFAWQHDAQMHPDGTITILDNATSPPLADQSRGIELTLDEEHMEASLKRRFLREPAVLTHAEANLQRLPNGNVLIGWGAVPSHTEHAPDGRQIFHVRFPRAEDSYRTYRFPWTGRPHTRPALAARRRGPAVRAWASWNGATEVARWQLLAGPRPGAMRVVASAPRTGFETLLGASTRARLVAVRALDTRGRPLGRSRAVVPTKTAARPS